ncbi:Asp23/Gls24 family envelope stress response protein [Spiroplasma endosymbiont of Labia minor]|uniref:Asp23/Gls24 family envelope stress response protein n=1 Tax=Spiroplasma endosymbiont of Labia minor TaxID=3066305 RepID=UPI0030D11F00
MTNKITQKVYDSIREAVVTVPGVISFVEFNKDENSVEVVKTTDTYKAIEVAYTDGMYRIRIHVMLIVGVNIPDVLIEIQVRVKYELERQSGFSENYLVDVVIDKLESLSV